MELGVGVARKESLTPCHLSKDATDGPDIAALLVFSFVHLPVRSFSHLLQFLVLFHFSSSSSSLLFVL